MKSFKLLSPLCVKLGVLKLALLVLILIGSSAKANDLAIMGQLAKDGAPQLALSLMDQTQPDAQTNIAGWMFFERQRIDVLRNWKNWDVIYQRLKTLPENTPPEMRQWAGLQRVDALLNLGSASLALKELQYLTWHTQINLDPTTFTLYRRLIIRSYLLDGLLDDAQRAINRYEQDYGAQGEAWRLLRGRVFIRTQQYSDAERYLKGLQGSEAVAMYYLATLSTSSETPWNIITTLKNELKKTDLLETDRLRFWWVIAEAYLKLDRPADYLNAIGQAVLYLNQYNQNDSVFIISPDLVWDAYETLGYEEGNRRQILLGDDEIWVELAKELKDKNISLSRGVSSVLMRESSDQAVRFSAQNVFVNSFSEQEELLFMLFTQSSRYQDMDQVSPEVRYQLIDFALSQGEIEVAARLMSGLQAPDDEDDYDWNLKRARITILSGNALAGTDILTSALEKRFQLDEISLDKTVQVVFDLQTIKAHEQAIMLLNLLIKRATTAKQQRELYFWLADSWKYQQNTPRAAAYYLRSATLLDGLGMDPWGQTARFNAAEVLLEGGMLEDAKRLFTKLLSVTQDVNRQAVIRSKLQELRLRQNYQGQS